MTAAKQKCTHKRAGDSGLRLYGKLRLTTMINFGMVVIDKGVGVGVRGRGRMERSGVESCPLTRYGNGMRGMTCKLFLCLHSVVY